MEPWKNVPRTEYILDWSPSAWGGQAWLNVKAMNRGRVSFDPLGLAVAEVQVGGGGEKVVE